MEHVNQRLGLQVPSRCPFRAFALTPLLTFLSTARISRVRFSIAMELNHEGCNECPVREPDQGEGEHWRYCLQCGHELINEKCKLRCPRCHYFMSCSDFDHQQG